MRHHLISKIVLAGMFLVVAAGTVMAQGPKDRPTDANRYSFSYTPVYQFQTDLDDKGSFDVNRHYLNFGFMRRFTANFNLGLGLSYAYEKWNFHDTNSLAGATPWTDIHRPGISLPMMYTFSGHWSLGFTPSIEYAGESGAEFGSALTYGGIFSLSRPFSRNLYLGLGFGLFDRLEEVSFFPFIMINWKINEQLRLSNPFRAGPAGPAGLELVYTPAEKWELGVGGAYRSYRFRLSDTNIMPDGVGKNEFVVSFLRLQRKLGWGITFDLAGGALFGGKVSVENSDGVEMATDSYEPSPLIALTIAGNF